MSTRHIPPKLGKFWAETEAAASDTDDPPYGMHGEKIIAFLKIHGLLLKIIEFCQKSLFLLKKMTKKR